MTRVGRTFTNDIAHPNWALKSLVPTLTLVILVAFIALLIHFVNLGLPDQAEKAILLIGAIFGIILVSTPILYLIVLRSSIYPDRLGLVVLATVCVLLVSIYLYWVAFYVCFPADIIIWAESDFINDILKFRTGYPLYSSFENNNSQVYTPAAPIVTYLIASLLGKATSIPLYRIIHIVFTLLAAIIAVFCCRRLIDMSFTIFRFRKVNLWPGIWLLIFFLMATNHLTNPFVYNLHNDALLQLASIGAYWLLLEYIRAGDKRLLALMAVLPACGFMIKQSFIIWAPLFCIYLILFDRPRSIIKVTIFASVAFLAIGAVVVICYLLWGEHFLYWVFSVLANRQINLLRSFQHILDSWSYLAIGLLGGIVLIRGRNLRQLMGAWLIWLIFFFIEGYTSGAAWTLSHLGPGSLIAGIWFVAAIVRLWPSVRNTDKMRFRFRHWLQTATAVAILCLIFNGLGFIRIPVKPLSKDAYRYISEIEQEFQGSPTKEILLDVGTWMYFKNDTVMKDRATSIGDRGFQGMDGFTGIKTRLAQKRYSKILVRNLHSKEFWYDHYLWPQSSGIRQAMLSNYREVRTIRPVSIRGSGKKTPYLFCEISVLMPIGGSSAGNP